MVHGFPAQDTVVEENGHIGHGAVLHSCIVRRDALVGMNAVVMDEAEIGEAAIVAACAFVPAGKKIPARSLAAGHAGQGEARTERRGGGVEAAKARSTYQDLTRRSLASMKEVEPLAGRRGGPAAREGAGRASR